jgi:hypothetical protein
MIFFYSREPVIFLDATVTHPFGGGQQKAVACASYHDFFYIYSREPVIFLGATVTHPVPHIMIFFILGSL